MYHQEAELNHIRSKLRAQLAKSSLERAVGRLGSNYLLLVSVKALAGVASPFHLQRSGLTVILLVWLVELVIVG